MDKPARIDAFLRSIVDNDVAPAVSVAVGNSREALGAWSLGRQTLAGREPLRSDASFLIASPTKPMIAMAIMMLVEAGHLQLAESAARTLPDFGNQGKRAITIAHLLTHSSGLPDMLPENSELRAAEAPLSEFFARTCKLRPAYPPGHDVQYQSSGYLVLGEIIRVVTGKTAGEFLRDRLFEPLGMRDTSLGLAADEARIPEIRIEGVMVPGAAVWNTSYWRRLAVPWGGVFSTAADLAKLCQHLRRIEQGEPGIVTRATLAAMTQNQFLQMPDIPERHRRCYPWGLGWQLNWPAHVTAFGDLLSDRAYGHWGATGSLVWIDDARDLYLVALTSQPLELGPRWLTRLSNLVIATYAQ